MSYKEEPTFSKLKKAIPEHLFTRPLHKSLYFLARDLFLTGLLLLLGLYVYHYVSMPFYLSIPFWSCYWFVQGSALTGLWVIAHECGHQAFSDYSWLNNAIGFILHSILLVPYFSWQETHSQHHRGTCSMERDTVFIPTVHTSNPPPEASIFEKAIRVTFMLLLGWPLYLTFNIKGQKYSRSANHFDPDSPMFAKTDKSKIIASDLGIVLTLSFLTWVGRVSSFTLVFYIYIMPYLWVNFWLVLYTYLHHTDPRVPHYRGEAWNFVRGALATIDRNYSIFSWMHHNIGDSHIVHHLFSKMPHYHAIKATPYIKKELGDLYMYDDTPIPLALWRTFCACGFVDENDGNTMFFKPERIERLF